MIGPRRLAGEGVSRFELGLLPAAWLQPLFRLPDERGWRALPVHSTR